MDIVINTSRIDYFLNLPADQMFWVFMGNFGWLIITCMFLYGMRSVYLFWLQNQWARDHKSVLLAIDIPKGNMQSPKAVENFFTYLAGAHGSVNFFEKWFEGKFQKTFSLEIISLEGYTQFLINTPTEFRNLVESGIYSQYPDAEISEIDDYVNMVPHKVPDEEYDLWGTEFIQAKPSVFPIKVYSAFEHMMGPSETQFRDPMAALMDLCSSLHEGEYLWYQIVLIPIGFDWVKDSEKAVHKILGKKPKAKKGLAMTGVEALGNLSEIIYPIWQDVDGKPKEEKPKTLMDLTPDEKRKIEGIQEKVGKLAFQAKIRTVYIARKEVMNKSKVANGLVGYMKQFAALDLNNLKPDVDMTFTKTVYFFKEPRLIEKKRKILSSYIGRSGWRGRLPGLYNIEELATLWHFPIEANVKVSMIQKAPGRKADAPAALPIAPEQATEQLPDIFQELSGQSNTQTNTQANNEAQPATENKTAPTESKPAAPENKQKKTPPDNNEDLGSKDIAPPDNLPFI